MHVAFPRQSGRANRGRNLTANSLIPIAYSIRRPLSPLTSHARSLPPPIAAAAAAAPKTPIRAEPVSATISSPSSSSFSVARRAAGDPAGEGGARGAGAEMASEDVVGKSRGDTAVTTIVNLAEEAKLAREGVKGPGHQVLTICKSLVAGGVAGGV